VTRAFCRRQCGRREAPQENVDPVKKLGVLRASLDIAKYADLTLAKEAAKRLAEANH
jgi:hypothetical protein